MAFTIEGSIGVGKSSVLNALQSRGFEVRQEPVHEWEVLLGEFYDALEGGNLAAKQSAGVRLQAKIMVDICLTDQTANFEERCGYLQPLTFMQHMLTDGSLSNRDYFALKELGATLGQKPFHVIYLRCDPEIAMGRVCKRNRECESNVTQEYVTAMHRVYEEAMMKCELAGVPVSTINVTYLDIEEVVEEVLRIRDLRYKEVMQG